MDEPQEWDLLPEDIFALLGNEMMAANPAEETMSPMMESFQPQQRVFQGHTGKGTKHSAKLLRTVAPHHQMFATASAVPKRDDKDTSPLLERINRARLESSVPRVGMDLKPRVKLNICSTALGPGTWSPLTRPIIHNHRMIVGTETAQARGPENYRNTTGLILCELDAPWKRNDTSKQMRAETEFVGTDSSIQDIQWLLPGESCVYATETELGICSFDKRKTLIEIKDPQERIRQLAVSQDRLLTGGFDEKVCYYNLSEGRRSLFNYWELRGVVGGVAWHPCDTNLLSFTLDSGSFGLIDVRSSSKGPSLLCDLGRGSLYAHSVVTDTIVAVGYGSGFGSLTDLRRAGDVPIDIWRDPLLTAIGEFIDPSSEITRPQNVTVAAGIGGLSVWDFSSGQARCLGQGNPLQDYSEFPFPSVGFKTSGVFLSNQDMVYAQTDAAGYLSLYDVGLH